MQTMQNYSTGHFESNVFGWIYKTVNRTKFKKINDNKFECLKERKNEVKKKIFRIGNNNLLVDKKKPLNGQYNFKNWN